MPSKIKKNHQVPPQEQSWERSSNKHYTHTQISSLRASQQASLRRHSISLTQTWPELIRPYRTKNKKSSSPHPFSDTEISIQKTKGKAPRRSSYQNIQGNLSRKSKKTAKFNKPETNREQYRRLKRERENQCREKIKKAREQRRILKEQAKENKERLNQMNIIIGRLGSLNRKCSRKNHMRKKKKNFGEEESSKEICTPTLLPYFT